VGNPLIFTWIVPVNPFTAAAASMTDFALPPAVNVRLDALVESVKSGLAAGVTFSVMGTEWLSVAAVAMNFTFVVPEVVVAAAVKLTFCGTPTASVRVAGVVVTPVGKPLTFTPMDPVKPLTAVAVSMTDCAAPPGVNVKLVALAVNVKSGLAAAAMSSVMGAVWLSVPAVAAN